MKKEIYICDRCGKEIQYTISTSKCIISFINKLKKTAEIKTMIAERCGYILDKYLSLPEVEKLNCTSFGEATRYVNNIRCINEKKCSRIVENLEERVNGK